MTWVLFVYLLRWRCLGEERDEDAHSTSSSGMGMKRLCLPEIRGGMKSRGCRKPLASFPQDLQRSRPAAIFRFWRYIPPPPIPHITDFVPLVLLSRLPLTRR